MTAKPSSVTISRILLAEDGVINIAITVGPEKQIIAGPDISMRGLLLPRDMSPDEFLQQLSADVVNILKDKKTVAKLSGEDLRAFLLGVINNHFSENFRSRPLVQLLIQEIKGVKKPAAEKQSAKTAEAD